MKGGAETGTQLEAGRHAVAAVLAAGERADERSRGQRRLRS